MPEEHRQGFEPADAGLYVDGVAMRGELAYLGGGSFAVSVRQVGDYLEMIISANANRIVGDSDDRVLESQRSFQVQIRSALQEVATSAEGALGRAEEYQAQGSLAVEREVQRIDALSDRLTARGLDTKGVCS